MLSKWASVNHQINLIFIIEINLDIKKIKKKKKSSHNNYMKILLLIEQIHALSMSKSNIYKQVNSKTL